MDTIALNRRPGRAEREATRVQSRANLELTAVRPGVGYGGFEKPPPRRRR